MHSTTIVATALTFTSALAQSSVTSLFLPDADQQALVASVVGSHASTITYAINCPAGTDSNDCGYPSPFTMTFGPSFYEAQTTDAPAFSYSVHCDLDGVTAATCTESAGGSEANFPGVSTETLTGTDAGAYLAVTITAGLNKLAGSSAGQTPGATNASATGSVASQTASFTKLTGTKSTGSATGTATGSATGSAAAAQSTGAAGGRTAMGMSAAGVVGVALAAFAL